VDYTDLAGRRKWKTFAGTEEGRELATVEKVRIDRMKRRGIQEEDESITFGAAWARWLRLKQISAKVQETVANYEQAGRIHFLPEWERVPLYRLQRNVVRDFLAAKIADGLARSTVRHRLVAPLIMFFSWCVNEEKLLVSHPALGLGRVLGLGSQRNRADKAITAPQLAALLERAKKVLDPVTYLGILILSDTGMRLGEAQGFTWDDVDLESSPATVRVLHQATEQGDHRGLKTEASYRVLGLTDRLRDAMRAELARREGALGFGRKLSPFVMCPEFGERPTRSLVTSARSKYRRRIAQIAKDVGIAQTVTPHSFRHTLATHLIEQGVDTRTVQDILRHASILETSDLYGKGARVKTTAALSEFEKRSTVQPAEVVDIKAGRK
jgi:integrase